jgi:hypothetical protein
MTPLEKKIHNLTDEDLLGVAKTYRIEARVNTGYYFHRRYAMILKELKERGYMK